jgi:glycerol-3-phosphate cytidylyltransferase-like family protein
MPFNELTSVREIIISAEERREVIISAEGVREVIISADERL